MSYKILLADDSVTVQKIITLTFSDEGVDVLAVDNGDDAIKRLQHMRPALVMADVSIPGRNGYEICEYVKTHPEMKNTPVVLLVPAFEPFDEERAKLIGADFHLTKPFQSIRTLISTVKNLIDPDAVGFTTRPPTQERANPKPPEEPKKEKINELIRQSNVVEAPKEREIVEKISATNPFDEPRRYEASPATVVENHRLKISSEPVALDVGVPTDDFDDILELDDVMPELTPEPSLAYVETVAVEEEIEAEEAFARGFAIPESAIDEIVNRVVDQLTERLPDLLIHRLSDQLTERVTERLTEELSNSLPRRIAAEVEELIKDQIFEEASSRRSVDNLLEID